MGARFNAWLSPLIVDVLFTKQRCESIENPDTFTILANVDEGLRKATRVVALQDDDADLLLVFLETEANEAA